MKYFIFTVIIAIFSYLCLNSTNLIYTYNVIFSNVAPTIYSLSSIVYYFFKADDIEQDTGLYSKETLSQYSGENGRAEIYLAILGKVFDVSKGSEHYAPGRSYHGFAGRDGTRAFITGEFTEEGLVEEISDFSNSDLLGIQGWVKMFEEKYTYKGKVIGKFYDAGGNPTPYLQEIEEQIKIMEEKQKEEKKDMQKFPPCNVEWTQESGSRVWCSTKSGGVQRSWVGVPRKYYQPGAKSYRCACVNLEEAEKFSKLGSFEVYADCEPKAESCSVKEF